MKNYVSLVVVMLCIGTITAQKKYDPANYPVVGKPCPDFILRNIKYYPKGDAGLKDFKGKWLVLDFWNKGCGACVASFPRVSSEQKQFGDKLQYMLVGIQDAEKQIQPMYAKFRERENLVMPCSFDSALATRWEIFTAPHLIIIDPGGIVRGITTSLTTGDIEGFLSGNMPHLRNPFQYDFEKETAIAFDPKKPYLVNGNGGTDSSFLFRSLLSKFDVAEQRAFLPRNIAFDMASGRFQAIGASLYQLYNFAYFGTSWPDDKSYHSYPLLELNDSSQFIDYSSNNGHNVFCYSLIIPPAHANKEQMQEIMQSDLKNYFGFTASIEERKFPCWKLTATEEVRQRLKSKGGQGEFKVIIPKADFVATNWPFQTFLIQLRNVSGKDIIDETGITGNIDLSMNSVLTDFNDLQKGLKEKGLELIPAERPMKVLVIKDKQ